MHANWIRVLPSPRMEIDFFKSKCRCHVQKGCHVPTFFEIEALYTVEMIQRTAHGHRLSCWKRLLVPSDINGSCVARHGQSCSQRHVLPMGWLAVTGYVLCFAPLSRSLTTKSGVFFRNCLHVGFSRQLPKSNRRPCCHAILVQHQRQRESTVPSVPIAADGLWTYDNLRHLHEWIMLMNNYVGSVRKKIIDICVLFNVPCEC